MEFIHAPLAGAKEDSMYRWHRELPRMQRRQLADLRKHWKGARAPKHTAGFSTECVCERGPGVFRKQRPFGCTRVQCFICGKHPATRRRAKRRAERDAWRFEADASERLGLLGRR